jgi:glycosyltransferase involved in cell wall biosynthesis
MTGLARQMERHVIGEAEAVVALTSWLAEWAVGLGADRDRIHVLPDAVSARLFGDEVRGDPVRSRLGLDGHDVIGFVGGFHRWHDISGLIDAFRILLERNPRRRLLLVGDGHERKALQKKVQSLDLTGSVLFTGKVPHDEVPPYIAAMDVAVVPYKPIDDFFFSPMKLFECMAMGRPTVAADQGQISEVIRHRETGWLYPPGDQERLVEGITALLDDRELASRVGKAARNYVLEQHTWERVTGQVVQIARGLIERRRRVPVGPDEGDSK